MKTLENAFLLDVRKKVLRIKQAYKDWLKFSTRQNP